MCGAAAQLDGRSVGGKLIRTAGAEAIAHAPDWRTRLLSTITNPSVAYILVLLGLYAIFFEFTNPGLVLPGVVGSICVLVALYAFHLLPVNYAGVALILLGIGFMVAEAFLPSFGSLGVGGVIAFAVGSVILIDTDMPEFKIPYALIAGLTAACVALLILVTSLPAPRAAPPVVSGREQLVGAAGEALEDLQERLGRRVHGEPWRVRCAVPGQARRAFARHRDRRPVLDAVPDV